MKTNVESHGVKMTQTQLQHTFFTPFFKIYIYMYVFISLWAMLPFLFAPPPPMDYHVFSFTSIRLLFVIMQMRKHAGNLIRAQIWFHMKDCSRVAMVVGAWWHNIEQPNYVQYLFSQWALDTAVGFLGLRCALVWRFQVNSPNRKVWLSFVLPRDAEWKVQLMGGVIFHISRKTRRLAFMHFYYCCVVRNQISKCSLSSLFPGWTTTKWALCNCT